VIFFEHLGSGFRLKLFIHAQKFSPAAGRTWPVGGEGKGNGGRGRIY
jgi:hypothetical protein